MKLEGNVEKSVSTLKNLILGEDIIYFHFKISQKKAVAVYTDSLTDKQLLGKLAIEPLMAYTREFDANTLIKSVAYPEAEKVKTYENCVKKIVSGDVIILVDDIDCAICVSCKKPSTRAISEPPTSSILKGPREGFVENLQMNLSLVRQRIKSPDLNYEKFTVGKYSQTNVGLLYIKGVANEDIVKCLRKKIESISIDGVVDSSYITKCISKRKTSLFKDVGTTEKPDILCAKLLEGRIAILVDGSPIVLTVPYLLVEDFQSSEDYYLNAYRANFSRGIRVSAVLVAILLPAIFVAAQLFHLQLIPLTFLLTIVGSIKGIPLSPSVEMFFTIFIFEILNEASIRMPRYVGIAMSVVGALVLGETAVNAGIVSTPTIMIVALSGICIYTVPEMTETLSVLRLMFLIVGGSFGGFGIIILACAIIIYLTSMDSFGVPYLSPYSPIVLSDLQDGFTLNFYTEMKKRPTVLKCKNKTRKG